MARISHRVRKNGVLMSHITTRMSRSVTDCAELTMNVIANSQLSGNLSVVWQFSVQEGEIHFQTTRNGVKESDISRHGMLHPNEQSDNKASSWWTRSKSCSLTIAQSLESLQTFHEGTIEHVTAGDAVVLRWDTFFSKIESRIRARASVVERMGNKRLEKSDEHEVVHEYRLKTLMSAKPLPYLIAKDLKQRPHLDQTKALENHQEALIRNLERAVTDMIAIFMNQPDVPLHEGSVRAFILSLEAILLDGIQVAISVSHSIFFSMPIVNVHRVI